jgi:hypothetical protein
MMAVQEFNGIAVNHTDDIPYEQLSVNGGVEKLESQKYESSHPLADWLNSLAICPQQHGKNSRP